jgi:KDO2-lipid IV(A) lauroyltransferase
MTAALLARLFGERGAAIVRRVDNPFLDRLVRHGRLAHPGQWIEKRGGTTEALARLRDGDCVALLLDENAGARGLFVDFFGRPASTQRSAALLALMADAPLVAGALVRDPATGERRFLLAEVPARAGLDETDAVVDLTRRATAVLEGWIRRFPEQWRWIHWRWRERPDGTSETYRRRDLARVFAPGPRATAAGLDAVFKRR